MEVIQDIIDEKKANKEQKDSGKAVYEFTFSPLQKIYYNPKNHYGIIIFKTSSDIPGCNEMHGGGYIGTLAGEMPEISYTLRYRVRTTLQYNKRFAKYQHEVLMIREICPTTSEDTRRFIESIFTKRQATEVLREYPDIVSRVIEGTDKVDVSKLKGIGEKTWKLLRDKILANFVLSDIITLLAPVGVTFTMIKKLAKNRKDLKLLKKEILDNPYILTDIKGLGFHRVDDIAKKIKPASIMSKERLLAGIKFVLSYEGEQTGNTWFPLSEVEKQVEKLCPECMMFWSDVINELKEAPQTVKYGMVIFEPDRLCLAANYRAEYYIHERLKELNKNVIEISDEEIAKGVQWANESNGFAYDESQMEIINKVIKGSGVQVIAGCAGTSKTTLSKALLRIYDEAGYRILAMALSAKAALRLQDATGYPANTIHKTLGATDLDTFAYGTLHKWQADVVLIDECSMIDIHLMTHALQAIKSTCKLILVGDNKQLPAIGFGNFFGDLINRGDSKMATITVLQKIYRTAENSGILLDANMIRQNTSPLVKVVGNVVHGDNNDMHYFFRSSQQEIFDEVVESYLQSIRQYGIDNVMVLIPKKANSINSTYMFNTTIQERLLPDKPFIKVGSRIFRQGCKVIHKVNNYALGVMNGEIGYITDIIDDGCEVRYKDKVISYELEDMYELDYAYAITVHSAQGNEFDVIYGIIDKSHYMLLDSTLLYTMITRARRQCYLYTDRFAFWHCIRTNKTINRNTFLSLCQETTWAKLKD